MFHQAPNEFDQRDFVPPAVYTPLTSDEYRHGVDPALAGALRSDSGPPVLDVVARLVAAGDSAGAERTLRAAQDETRNRFRSLERDVNALGYQLLDAGSVAQAVQVGETTRSPRIDMPSRWSRGFRLQCRRCSG